MPRNRYLTSQDILYSVIKINMEEYSSIVYTPTTYVHSLGINDYQERLKSFIVVTSNSKDGYLGGMNA